MNCALQRTRRITPLRREGDITASTERAAAEQAPAYGDTVALNVAATPAARPKWLRISLTVASGGRQGRHTDVVLLERERGGDGQRAAVEPPPAPVPPHAITAYRRKPAERTGRTAGDLARDLPD
ncbi:MAG: hypothetical protein NVS3B1_27270 [Marmoricola sp.]